VGSITLIGGGVVLGLAFITNPIEMIRLSTAIISTRGMTFLAKKMTQTMNKDSADMIDFAGWCLTGVPLIALLKLSTAGITQVADSFDKTAQTIGKIALWVEKISSWIESLAK